MDWSLVVGIGMPSMTGLILLVRMENRVTQLEKDRDSDQRWRETVTHSLDEISKNLNQLIGRDLGKP